MQDFVMLYTDKICVSRNNVLELNIIDKKIY